MGDNPLPPRQAFSSGQREVDLDPPVELLHLLLVLRRLHFLLLLRLLLMKPPGHELTCRGRSELTCPALRTFFHGEKCEKPHHQAHWRHHRNQLESEKTKTLANTVLGGNLEAFTGKMNDLLHSPLRNAFLGKLRRCLELCPGRKP